MPRARHRSLGHVSIATALCRPRDHRAVWWATDSAWRLARAIAPRPRLLLLDEPLSALDASLREALRDELAILLREFDITAIFVTHDQDEALAIADRVAVMSHGRVVQSGTPEDLYRNPTSSFVAGFVGNAMALRGRAGWHNAVFKGGQANCHFLRMARARQSLCALKMFGLSKKAHYKEKWKP